MWIVSLCLQKKLVINEQKLLITGKFEANSIWNNNNKKRNKPYFSLQFPTELECSKWSWRDRFLSHNHDNICIYSAKHYPIESGVTWQFNWVALKICTMVRFLYAMLKWHFTFPIQPVWLYRLHDSGIGHINILIYKPHIFQSESNKSNFSLILFNF